jgi:hypothetical protein
MQQMYLLHTLILSNLSVRFNPIYYNLLPICSKQVETTHRKITFGIAIRTALMLRLYNHNINLLFQLDPVP